MSVTAQEPPQLRLTDIHIDLKKLFLRLGEAIARIGLAKATGDWKGAAGGIVTGAFGAMEAVSLETKPSVLAWELVRNGLARAIGELTAESLTDRGLNPGDEHYIGTKIELVIGEDAICIEPNFFKNPASLPLVHRVEVLFADWLQRYLDLPPQTSSAVARRLPSYFAVALHEEWLAHTGNKSGIDISFSLSSSLISQFLKSALHSLPYMCHFEPSARRRYRTLANDTAIPWSI
jgi:hypothetical protein